MTNNINIFEVEGTQIIEVNGTQSELMRLARLLRFAGFGLFDTEREQDRLALSVNPNAPDSLAFNLDNRNPLDVLESHTLRVHLWFEQH
jgi:hypothetical protein